MDRSSPRCILICRLSAVGDCIHTLPLACAIREYFPQTRIGWVVQRGAATLLAGHPCIDELIVVDRRWLRSLRDIRQVREELRTLGPDVVLDPQSLTKSALAGWFSGAQRRIGFSRPHARELSPWLNTELVGATRSHVVERYLELLRPLGVDRPAVRFQLPEDADAQVTISQFLRQSHLGCGFALINPGAGWDSKLWSAGRFGKVARNLGEQHSLPTVVVWAGERERDWAEEIVGGSGGHALLAPSTSLTELAALARAARLFVGSDTGPLHLAAAVGTPCVGLYGPTRPEVCGPYGTGHVSIQGESSGGSMRGSRDNQAMQQISIESVCRSCDTILARQAKGEQAA